MTFDCGGRILLRVGSCSPYGVPHTPGGPSIYTTFFFIYRTLGIPDKNFLILTVRLAIVIALAYHAILSNI